MKQSLSATVLGMSLTFSIDSPQAQELDISLRTEHVPAMAETWLVRFSARSPSAGIFSIRDLSIAWSVPAVDMHGFYSGVPSIDELTRLPYWSFRKYSCANSGLPFFALIHRGGENRLAFGLLDQLTETALEAELSEATRSYSLRLHKPAGPAALVVSRWEEVLFLSAAHRPWPQVLQAYVQSLDRDWPQPRLAVPENAYEPVFCTWTAIHHQVSQDWVLRNARLAADLGFGTWITDDGWFTDQARFADYRYTGDWLPCLGKFPDFAGQVAAVQAMGLRYLLWVAPFMVGEASQAVHRHAHLLGAPDPRLHFRNLSPRHPETREVVGDLLHRLMSDYGLDGLKIDFIDSVLGDPGTPGRSPGEGAGTLGQAIYDVLSGAMERITVVKPQALIEFRSTYANLCSRRYANLYRASDVPINFALNRWQITMLRLLAPDRAVLLDPALWHPGDTEENVAAHLINAISTVPMLSVELERYPPAHLRLIRAWIAFYRDHKNTIVHGTFAPEIRLGHVPLIRFFGDSERIIGLYDDVAFAPGEGPTPLWILNASTRPSVALLPEGLSGVYTVRTRDRFARLRSERTVSFPVASLEVEVGGSLEILR